MKKIKSYILKYFLLVFGLIVLTLVLGGLLPELYNNINEGEGYNESITTIFALYQKNVIGLIIGLAVAADLFKIKHNYLVIPLVTILDYTTGLFLFGILITYNQIKTRHGEEAIS